MHKLNLVQYHLTILPSEYNINFRNENSCLKLTNQDQLSSLSHQKKDINLVDMLFFHEFLQINVFKIFPNSLLFLHSKILTTFQHQNILLFNQEKQFIVIQILDLSFDVMIFSWLINLIKIHQVVHIFLIHIQIQHEKEISLSLKF
jgi:hypothetical protein